MNLRGLFMIGTAGLCLYAVSVVDDNSDRFGLSQRISQITKVDKPCRKFGPEETKGPGGCQQPAITSSYAKSAMDSMFGGTTFNRR